MFDFFRAGGFNMLPLAGMGIVLLVTAVKFARAADPHRLSIIRALTFAVLISSFVGFMVGLSSTALYVVRHEPDDPLPYLLKGFSESTTNIMLGGGITVVTWTLVAVGVRRMPNDRT
jgi:hypothetical protein